MRTLIITITEDGPDKELKFLHIYFEKQKIA